MRSARGNLIFDILEQSSFQKYATCWVFLALHHMLYLLAPTGALRVIVVYYSIRSAAQQPLIDFLSIYMMFYDVLFLKSILGFFLLERTFGVSPVLFNRTGGGLPPNPLEKNYLKISSTFYFREKKGG